MESSGLNGVGSVSTDEAEFGKFSDDEYETPLDESIKKVANPLMQSEESTSSLDTIDSSLYKDVEIYGVPKSPRALVVTWGNENTYSSSTSDPNLQPWYVKLLTEIGLFKPETTPEWRFPETKFITPTKKQGPVEYTYVSDVNDTSMMDLGSRNLF